VRPVVPVVSINVNGKVIELPATPVRSTNANGITEYNVYQATVKVPASGTGIPKVTASSNNPTVKVNVTQAATKEGKAVVTCNYKGVVKTYNVLFVAE
jgi:arabinoxylan arabinofuranohydrolase